MIMLFFLVVPFSVNGQSGKANFSGTWTMNVDKSDAFGGPGGGGPGGGGPGGGGPGGGGPGGGGPGGGGPGGPGGGDMKVTQDANTLTQERTMGDFTMESKYTLDGKESVNSMGMGESKSVATWSADGKSLTIVTKMNFGDRDMTTTEVWTLTDAKTLTIERTMPSREGDERKMKTVYDKK